MRINDDENDDHDDSDDGDDDGGEVDVDPLSERPWFRQHWQFLPGFSGTPSFCADADYDEVFHDDNNDDDDEKEEDVGDDDGVEEW